MVSVAGSQKIDSVSLPVALVDDIADQLETLISIIEENDLETDKFEDYLLETKKRAKLKREKPINIHGGIPRGG